MKASILKRTISLLLVIISVFSIFAISAGAAYSEIQVNISESATDRNLSAGPLPPAAGEFWTGRRYYVNLAATSDFYLRTFTLYLCEPGQSSYYTADSYKANNYYRWYNTAVTFGKTGTYGIKIVITTTDGTEYYCEWTVDVKGGGSTGGGNEYNYYGTRYQVVPNFNSSYYYNQNDYSRFVNWKGNRGCTATAMCSAWAIYHNRHLSPNSVKWSSEGCYWEYCKRYSAGGKTYYGWSYTQAEALQCAYDSVMNGVPMIVGVGTRSHVVTIVGVRVGANRNSLNMGDFLILDPNGGTVSTLSKYSCIDREWALRVPV